MSASTAEILRALPTEELVLRLEQANKAVTFLESEKKRLSESEEELLSQLAAMAEESNQSGSAEASVIDRCHNARMYSAPLTLRWTSGGGGRQVEGSDPNHAGVHPGWPGREVRTGCAQQLASRTLMAHLAPPGRCL